MTERWIINRAGLINFWYYDDEEFQFSNGKLLLRGSNGSGKSVTMQSLIPLLLDGNKSPERLDPFGTKARKMENYLIGDDYDTRERTAYLYLEFCKPNSDKYMTIGLGMKAQENKKMDSWYFVIKDNRRIGKDIYMYKNLDGKFALSRKELENRLGDGGELFKSQKEYMARVNHLLFGYERTEEYEELIKLLVQLRSPKLSKDFKPTVIYEIMSNSLQTLSEDDLRPMSEAIENMEGIKNQLDILKNSQKAVKYIQSSYDDYNKFILLDKANAYSLSANRVKKLEQTIKDYTKKQTATDEKIDELTQEETKTIDMIEVYKEKKKQLEANDLFQLKEANHDLGGKIKEGLEELNNKNGKLDDARIKERDIHNKMKDANDELDELQGKITNTLQEMDDCAEEAEFDEHAFFRDEYKDKQDMYPFDYIVGQADTYKSTLRQALDAIKEEDTYKRIHDECIKAKDDASRQVTLKEKDEQQAQLHFDEIKEEMIEKFHHWLKTNKHLHIGDDEVRDIIHDIYQYGIGTSYADIQKKIYKAYEKINGKYAGERIEAEGVLKQLEQEKNDIQKELVEWLAKKDPEPERSESILNSRSRLDQHKIPYVPLYKAIDFQDALSREEKNYIEEAFIEMGILDALIIPEPYMNQVKALQGDFHDKILLGKPSSIQHGLIRKLKREKLTPDIAIQVVDDVLKSITSKYEDTHYIHESGWFGLGILTGKISGQYESKYIGIKSRQRYKEQKIDEITQMLNEKKEQIVEQEHVVQSIRERIAQLEQEYEGCIQEQDMKTAYTMWQEAHRELEDKKRTLITKEEETKTSFKNWQEKRDVVRATTIKLTISPSKKIVQEALESIEEYTGLLQKIQLEDQACQNMRIRIADYDTSYQMQLELMDDLMYDINRLERQNKVLEQQLKNNEEILANAGIKNLEDELETCITQLEELPEKRLNIAKELASLYKEKEYMVESITTNTKKLNHEKMVYDIYKDSLKDEIGLGYIEHNPTQDESFLKQATKLIERYKHLQDRYQSRDDYAKKLQEKYHRHSEALTEYQLQVVQIGHKPSEHSMIQEDERMMQAVRSRIRLDLEVKVEGKKMSFKSFSYYIREALAQFGNLVNESDRHIFEDILLGTIGNKIRARIANSEKWVREMNVLMESMNTSSGLSFSLNWRNKKAESEDQMGTRELVDILRMDAKLLTPAKREKVVRHFRSKIKEARMLVRDTRNHQSFFTVIKEVLDYRQWFEFQLYFTKLGDKKKELTNNAFFTFSGGEKAMAMYVPLFSSVYAKYEGARPDCPRIISLDEAFAGVDHRNIRDMFRLLIQLNLSFVMNSQVLWGDYDTVPNLAIVELVRPENAKFVTSIRYYWNGYTKTLMPNDRESYDQKSYELAKEEVAIYEE